MLRHLTALIIFLLLIPAPLFAKVPLDPFFTEQWYLNQIHAPEVWDTETGSRATIVAIIDSGVDLDHEDLAGNLWVNALEITGNGLDDDANGYVDDRHGWDFVDGDGTPTPTEIVGAHEDALSHGSLVAGLVGAVTNNATGVAGVNWDVRIMPLRVLDESGAGSSTDVAEAIDYAVANGADVINLSFSGTETHQGLRTAIERAYQAGVVIVAALGNEGTSTNDVPIYPACYVSNEEDLVIGVASTNRDDEKAKFSNYGSSCTDISAPGVDIFGVHYYNPAIGETTDYAGGWSGTSMSSPLVSGAVALLLSAHPELTPEQVKVSLQLSVDPVSGLADVRNQMGAGRLNLAQAFKVADSIVGMVITTGITPDYIKAPSFEMVYHVVDGERRAFINASTYFTYEDSFSPIVDVADTSLADYALTGVILPKPGVVLIKIQSDPRVYAIEENPSDPYVPILRAIDSEEIARVMYGADWADYVIDIEPTYFAKFKIGTTIHVPEPVDTSIMKTRTHLAQLANS